MDKSALETSSKSIVEAQRAYNRALDRGQKAKVAHDKAKAETQSAKEAYLNALEEAKKAVSG